MYICSLITALRRDTLKHGRILTRYLRIEAAYASVNSSGAHPPRATVGHLLTLSVPGVGHSQLYRSPGGLALAYPGVTPGI